jgi:hypothetical protein
MNSGSSFYYIQNTKYVYSTALSANDFAYLYDGNGGTAYEFSGTAYSLELGTDSGQSFQNYALGFAFDEGVAVNPGLDIADFYDSPGNDLFTGFTRYTTETSADGTFKENDIFAQNSFVTATAQVYAFSFVGGTDQFNNQDPTVNHFFNHGVPVL